MKNCDGCGAPVARRDRACSYCGSDNDAYQSPPPELETLLAHGIESVRQGRNAEAVSTLRELLTRDPESVDAYYYLASAWQELGRIDNAIEAMTVVSRLRPGSATACFNLGILFTYSERQNEARPYLEKALELVDGDYSDKLLPEQKGDIRQRASQELKRLEGPDSERS
jgi:tetratricopeptide (TPR) repeat protein